MARCFGQAMLRCGRERKPEGRASVRRLPAAASPLPLESTNLRLHRSRDNFEHSSLSMSDAGACGGASRRLSVGPREHGPPSTPFLHRTCQRKHMPMATILCARATREISLSCPPNVHAELRAASRACLSAARQPPRLTKASEGAMCGWRDAEQFGAAPGGSAAGPTDRRLDSSSG